MKRFLGFTLLEFTIVLVIIGIIAVFVSFFWPDSIVNLDAAANQIANDIRYTQSLSMNKGERYRWIKTSATTYQIVDSGGSPILLSGGNTTQTLASGITFGSLVNLPNNLVAFDGKGVPYTDTGSTQLSSTASIALIAQSDSSTILITPQTGRVSVP